MKRNQRDKRDRLGKSSRLRQLGAVEIGPVTLLLALGLMAGMGGTIVYLVMKPQPVPVAVNSTPSGAIKAQAQPPQPVVQANPPRVGASAPTTPTPVNNAANADNQNPPANAGDQGNPSQAPQGNAPQDNPPQANAPQADAGSLAPNPSEPSLAHNPPHDPPAPGATDPAQQPAANAPNNGSLQPVAANGDNPQQPQQGNPPANNEPDPTSEPAMADGPTPPPAPQPTQDSPMPASSGNAKPKIDLKSVEYALWRTKPKDPKNFNVWMQQFEDEVNSVYFATLRRQYPNEPVQTLMPKPVRVEPKRVNRLLVIRGYIDQNEQPGYQPPKDQLLFAFEQRQPYRPGDNKISYTLYDDSGFYYRRPGYTATVDVQTPPVFINFFVTPGWDRPYYRPRFVWFRPMWWQSPRFSMRYRLYYGLYPSYQIHHHRYYGLYYRPVGWRTTVFYQRGWWKHRWVGRGHAWGHYKHRGHGWKFKGHKWKYKGHKWKFKGHKWKHKHKGHYRGRGHRGSWGIRGFRGFRRGGGKW